MTIKVHGICKLWKAVFVKCIVIFFLLVWMYQSRFYSINQKDCDVKNYLEKNGISMWNRKCLSSCTMIWKTGELGTWIQPSFQHCLGTCSSDVSLLPLFTPRHFRPYCWHQVHLSSFWEEWECRKYNQIKTIKPNFARCCRFDGETRMWRRSHWLEAGRAPRRCTTGRFPDIALLGVRAWSRDNCTLLVYICKCDLPCSASVINCDVNLL